MPSNKLFSFTVLLLIGLSTSFALYATEPAKTAKIVSVIDPVNAYGVQIGDKLSRKIVLEVPAPFKIADTALPKKGSKNNGVELVAVDVAVEQQNEHTLYTLDLCYQPFTNSGKATILSLPAVEIALTGGAEVASLEVPAWGFWFSPIVAGGVEVAQKNLQPEISPPKIDVSAHQLRLLAFAGMFMVSLLALIYINADGSWLPFMGGAFARAHRQLKRLARSAESKNAMHEKQALVYVHEAFNQHYGANMFARDIERFVAKHFGFRNAKAEITQFFDTSNQSLYAIKPRDSQRFIAELVLLSKYLRNCERGV